MGDARLERASRIVFGERGEILFESEMQIVAASTFIGVSGVFVVSPILSDLTGTFLVSDARIGLVMTLFTAPSVVLAPVLGLLTDRLGRKPVLVGGLLVFGIAGTAIAFAPTFQVLLALRVLQGTGFAAVILVGVALLGDHYRGNTEITAQGVRFASIQAATLGLPLLAGWLVLVSWRYPFFLFAGGILAAIWGWLVLPEPAVTTDASVREYAHNLVSLLSNPVMGLVVASFTLRFVLSFGFFAYVSVLLSDVTDSATLFSGFAIALFGLVSLGSGSQIGRITGSRHPLVVLVAGFLLGSGGMTLMGLSGLLPVVFLGVIVFAIGNGLSAPVQKSFVNAFASRELRGGAVSGSMLFQNLGQTVGPLVFGGLLAVVSPRSAFVLIGAIGGVLGAAACWIAYVLTKRWGMEAFELDDSRRLAPDD